MFLLQGLHVITHPQHKLCCITNTPGTRPGGAPFYNSTQGGVGNAPVYGTQTGGGTDQWVSYDPSADVGVKNMVQVGTWTGKSGMAETCTKLYERHKPSQDRTTYESDPNQEILNRDSVNWRSYGYCCSGIFLQWKKSFLKMGT